MNDFVTAVLALPGAFSARECGLIRDLTLPVGPEVDFYPPPAAPTRRAESCLVPHDVANAWITARLAGLARKANESFRVALTGEIYPVLRVRYRPGDFFDWHSDLGDGAESSRKLSLSLQLSPPEDFGGGQLQFVGAGDPAPAPAIGTLLVFPSHFAHRVTPVTRGQRHALVAWMHGPPFT